MHKNDPGVYEVRLYRQQGRKHNSHLVNNYTKGVALITKWKRRTGYSGTLHRCVFNSELPSNRF